MKTDEIKERNANLQLKEVFDDAPLVKGIKSFHHIKIIDYVCHGRSCQVRQLIHSVRLVCGRVRQSVISRRNSNSGWRKV